MSSKQIPLHPLMNTIEQRSRLYKGVCEKGWIRIDGGSNLSEMLRAMADNHDLIPKNENV